MCQRDGQDFIYGHPQSVQCTNYPTHLHNSGDCNSKTRYAVQTHFVQTPSYYSTTFVSDSFFISKLSSWCASQSSAAVVPDDIEIVRKWWQVDLNSGSPLISPHRGCRLAESELSTRCLCGHAFQLLSACTRKLINALFSQLQTSNISESAWSAALCRLWLVRNKTCFFNFLFSNLMSWLLSFTVLTNASSHAVDTQCSPSDCWPHMP